MRLLRQYLYICTIKASKLSTCQLHIIHRESESPVTTQQQRAAARTARFRRRPPPTERDRPPPPLSLYPLAQREQALCLRASGPHPGV